MITNTKNKRPAQKLAARVSVSRPTVGTRIIEGLEQAIAWTRGTNEKVKVTLVHGPEAGIREVRTKRHLSTPKG